jgi:hypothetical protein
MALEHGEKGVMVIWGIHFKIEDVIHGLQHAVAWERVEMAGDTNKLGFGGHDVQGARVGVSWAGTVTFNYKQGTGGQAGETREDGACRTSRMEYG